MIATSPALAAWAEHIAGHKRIAPPLIRSPMEIGAGKEYTEDSDPIIDSFGRKTFEAAVGFVDMRGFSELAFGKTPTEVRAIAAPFVAIVIDCATKYQCFIDKVIGDEVMLVMPVFSVEVLSAPTGYGEFNSRRVNGCLDSVSDLLGDLVQTTNRSLPQVGFSSGFALGPVLLDQIGTDAHSEWTVYGNSVNGAKRLQSLPARDAAGTSKYRTVVGAVENERPRFRRELDWWVETQSWRSAKLVAPIIE